MRLGHWLLIALALAWARPAHAYAWMLRFQHSDCASCHADPSGGGLLTPYGRKHGRSLLSGNAERDAPANDFLFGALELPSALLLGADYRGAVGSSSASDPGASTLRYTQRQLDVAAELRLGRLRVNGSVGYDHDRALAAAVTTRARDNLISRTHWLGVALGAHEEALLRAGRIGIPYGIRGLERSFFVRSPELSGFGVHADIEIGQQHGVAFAYSRGQLRTELMGILGNYQLSPSVFRERGYAGYVEWAALPAFAIGASSSITHAERSLDLGVPLWRHAHGLFARAVPWQPLAVLAQGDLLASSTAPGATPSGQAVTQLGYAALLQADCDVWRGLHAILTLETGRPALPSASASYAGWASLAWFFVPHADLRIDAIQQSLSLGDSRQSVSSWSAALHASL